MATASTVKRSTKEVKQSRVDSGKVAKQPVKKVIPKTHAASGMRTVEIMCELEELHMAKVVQTKVQEAVAKGWLEASARTGDELVTARELYYGIYDDLLNAARPSPSHYLSSTNVPLRYRELFEGIKSATKAVRGGPQLSFRWTGIRPEDTVGMTHIFDYHGVAELNTMNAFNGSCDANGFHVIDNTPAIPSHNRMKEAVQHYFSCILSEGEPKWLGGKTAMLDSVSVFAFSKEEDDSLDWQKMGKTMSLEVPIDHQFLAGLQLVKNTEDSLKHRTAKKFRKFYVGPGQIYGHQILRKYTGYQGGKDVIQLNPVDLSAFVTDLRSLMNGAMNQAERSTAAAIIDATLSGAPGVNYPFATGDDTGLEMYINLMWGQQMLSTSPVTLNAIPKMAGCKRVRWGTQCFRMSPRKLGRLFCFKKEVENLRMLHPTSVEVDVSEDVMFYYSAGYWPDVASQLDQTVYEHAAMNWTANSFGGLQPQDIGNLHAHNFSESASKFKDYVVELNEQFHGAKDFHPILDIQPHAETQIGGQLNLLMGINPVVAAAGVVFTLDEAIAKKLLTECSTSELEKYTAALKRRDQEIRKENLFSKNWSKDKKEKKVLKGSGFFAPQLTLGVSSVLPRSGRFDVFKQMVFPQRNVDVNTKGNPFSKMAIEACVRDTIRSDSETIAPLVESMLSAYTHTHTRSSTFGVKTELMQVLEKRSAMGLGSGTAGTMSTRGLIGQVVGGETGAFGDAVLGMNPFAAVVNEVGGWVMSGVNGVLGTTPQQRQAARQQRRRRK